MSRRRKETLAQRLKRLREERGLSQRQLASGGISYAYVSRIEAGTRSPSVVVIRRLAERLKVTPEYLETGVDRKQTVYLVAPSDMGSVAVFSTRETADECRGDGMAVYPVEVDGDAVLNDLSSDDA